MESPFAPGARQLRWAARFGFARDGRILAGRVALLLAGLTWLPMLLLTLAAGTAYGDHLVIPFLGDFIAYGRHLAALPLLVLVHPLIDRELVRVLGNLKDSGVVRPADDPLLQQKLAHAGRLWRSPLARLLLVAATVVAAILMSRVAISIDAPDWLVRGDLPDPALSAAGWWHLTVAGPIFRLLVLIAFWKLAIWSWFLLQLARMPLNYQTLHADGCAGLGILERVVFGFSGVAAALAIQFGCIMADAVFYKGHELASFRLPAIAFVVVMIVLILLPMAAFIRPLAEACIRAELAFHAWFGHAANGVDRSIGKTGDRTVAAAMDSPEFSSLADASTLYAGALRTRRIPVTRRSLVVLILASVVPMAVPLLPLLPFKEIALRLVKVVM